MFDSYVEAVIRPIEENRNKLRSYYYSKNFFKRLNRKFYKEYLDKYDSLLLEKYKILEQIMGESNNN